jgi:hypothetical protein
MWTSTAGRRTRISQMEYHGHRAVIGTIPDFSSESAMLGGCPASTTIAACTHRVLSSAVINR